MKIILDANDAAQAPWLVSQISGHPLLGIPEIKPLDCGDIWLLGEFGDIIIERKSPNDLLASIADNRLSNQCAKMRQENDKAILLITGQWLAGIDGKILGTGWHFNAVDAALVQVQEFGVTVCYCLNDLEISNKLVWLATRKWTEHVILPPRKFGLPMPEDQKVLASLPGIGYERALELLKERNLRNALLCLLDEKCTVPGIGPKTKQNIRELFSLIKGQNLELKGE